MCKSVVICKFRKFVIVFPHQGLGDFLICNGIFREFAKNNKKVFVAVKKSNAHQVCMMLQDVDNISFLVFANRSETVIFCAVKMLGLLGFNVVLLGFYGKSFFTSKTRFDESFYAQSGLSLELRWNNFVVPRNEIKEQLLYSRLVVNEPYIFLHEDRIRNILIDRKLINSTLHIVEPIPQCDDFTIFDYLMIIENAAEIHVIESSFAHLIESIEVSGERFAHRYARSLVMDDFRQTPTYRHDWHILT